MEAKRTKILIVDDSRNIRTLLSVILKNGKHVIIESGDGNEALEKTRKERPDLILLDVSIPGKDGMRVCREIKSDRRTKNIPVIMITSDTSDETRQKAISGGAAAFITKPFEPKEIRETVEKLLFNHGTGLRSK
jgi:two-component system response regulator ResD